MTIHDFDLARFALGEEVTQVSAFTSNLFDKVAQEIGEIDSAMILMKTASGKLCHINNSRHATYGYDQRLEAHTVWACCVQKIANQPTLNASTQMDHIGEMPVNSFSLSGIVRPISDN